MVEILALASAIVAVTSGVVQAVKTAFNLQKTIIPLLAILIGVLLGAAAFVITDIDLVSRIWAGGISGLASVGLFELGNKREGTTKGEG